jgi:hypothetical protein
MNIYPDIRPESALTIILQYTSVVDNTTKITKQINRR